MHKRNENNAATEPRTLTRTFTIACTVTDAETQTEPNTSQNSERRANTTKAANTLQSRGSVRDAVRAAQRPFREEQRLREEKSRQRQEYLELYREEIEKEYNRKIEEARRKWKFAAQVAKATELPEEEKEEEERYRKLLENEKAEYKEKFKHWSCRSYKRKRSGWGRTCRGSNQRWKKKWEKNEYFEVNKKDQKQKTADAMMLAGIWHPQNDYQRAKLQMLEKEYEEAVRQKEGKSEWTWDTSRRKQKQDNFFITK